MAMIPRNIDDPASFLLIGLDELLVFTACMVLGIIFEYTFSMMIFGIVVAYILSKYKKSQADGFLLHFLYWHGIIPLKKCPPSWIKEFLD